MFDAILSTWKTVLCRHPFLVLFVLWTLPFLALATFRVFNGWRFSWHWVAWPYVAGPVLFIAWGLWRLVRDFRM